MRVRSQKAASVHYCMRRQSFPLIDRPTTSPIPQPTGHHLYVSSLISVSMGLVVVVLRVEAVVFAATAFTGFGSILNCSNCLIADLVVAKRDHAAVHVYKCTCM